MQGIIEQAYIQRLTGKATEELLKERQEAEVAFTAGNKSAALAIDLINAELRHRAEVRGRG